MVRSRAHMVVSLFDGSHVPKAQRRGIGTDRDGDHQPPAHKESIQQIGTRSCSIKVEVPYPHLVQALAFITSLSFLEGII